MMPNVAKQYRKKPVVITASQWFKNGDHPNDGDVMFAFGEDYEGEVVRRYRRPDVPGESPCEQCGEAHHVHGWVDTLEQGHRVCPGDWIITGVAGEMYPCKPDIFARTYESVDDVGADLTDEQIFVLAEHLLEPAVYRPTRPGEPHQFDAAQAQLLAFSRAIELAAWQRTPPAEAVPAPPPAAPSYEQRLRLERLRHE